MNRLSLLALCALSVGCGPTNPGGGSRTLFVSARLSTDGSTPGTRARVTVREGSTDGALVDDAEVVLRGERLGRRALSYDDNPRVYRLDDFAWEGAFRLEVVRGRDFLDGALEVPGVTTITQPIADTTWRRGDGLPLVVKWTDGFNHSAQRVQVRFDKANIDTTLSVDGVEFRAEPSQLTPDDREQVRVERTNEVPLAGGAAGSTLSAATTHEVEFRVE